MTCRRRRRRRRRTRRTRTGQDKPTKAARALHESQVTLLPSFDGTSFIDAKTSNPFIKEMASLSSASNPVASIC